MTINLNPRDFGPNGAQVVTFLASLHDLPWFGKVGEPTPEDAQLARVGFDFIARNYEAPYAPWHGLVEAAEASIEQLCVEQGRLQAQEAVQRAVRLEPHGEELFKMLFEEYEDYYGNTQAYAHELVELPDRLIRGAACEQMLADLAPELRFFQGLMPWFARGHWPCGWEGDWPQGKLILW